MRQALINENKDLCDKNQRYVMRITGSDAEGQAQLGNFIDPEANTPCLSRPRGCSQPGWMPRPAGLLSSIGRSGSMTEFKQIVGRGTRVHEDTKKFYFTLIDFRGATSHFADPDFDGEPVQIYEPGDNDPMTPPDDVPTTSDDEEPIPPKPGADEVIVDQARHHIKTDEEKPRKIYVDGVGVTVHRRTRRVSRRERQADHRNPTGFHSRGPLKKRFASLDDFLKRWKSAERKQAIIEELENEGLSLDTLAEEVGKDLDPFDLICHVAFDQPPLTPARARGERSQARCFREVRPAGASRA